MALQVWLPLNGNLNNQGLSDITITSNGTTSYSDGKIGQGLNCNGSSNWKIPNITIGTTASICCWSKTIKVNKMMWVLDCATSKYLNLYNYNIYTLNIGDSNNNPFLTDSGNNITALTDNMWHHFVVTFDGSQAKLYIDGEYKGKAKTYRSPQTNASHNILKIAGDFNNTHSYDWNGMLNDFRLYDHCLSPKEVKELSKGLVLHYKLDDPYIESTKNYVLNSDTFSNWGSYGNGYTSIINSEIGNKKIVITNKGTWCGMWVDITLPSTGTYTISAWCKPIFRSSTSVNQTIYTSGGGLGDISQGVSWSNPGKWQRISMTQTYTSTTLRLYLIAYGGTRGTDIVSCEYCMPQIEKLDHPTLYTNNERGIQIQYDKNIYTESDGTYWVKIAHHNNPAGGVFSSSSANWSNGVYIDSNRWFDVYNVVKQLQTFEFMVKQKTTSSASETKYRWIQNISPLLATWSDVKPDKVTRITTSGYTNGGNGGLYILNTSTHMCIANSSNGNWFGAFGSWSTYNGGIPGYPNTTITNGYMDLYVRVDDLIRLIYDCSGYNNDGKFTGYLQIDNDSPRYNYCMKFNGTEYIYKPNSFMNIKTMCAWVKTTKNKSTSQMICSDSNSKLCISFYNGTIISYYSSSGASTGSKCTLGSSYKENDWNFFVVVDTGEGTRDIYCNNVKLTPTSNDYWQSQSNGIYIGARNIETISLPFFGNISDIRFYATALSDDDIKELYDTPTFIDNQGDLLTGEFVENDEILIDKTGITEAIQFVEEGTETQFFVTNKINSTQILEI